MHDFWKISLTGLTTALLLGTNPASANERPGPSSYDWHVCADEARRLEIQENIPKLLLTAVTHTETGRRGPNGRRIMSWPWTLHADGRSLRFNSKADAVKAVRALMARGINVIDVGCMQVNLRYHPHAFTSVEEALDPAANLAYAVAYLKKLKNRHNGWPAAIQHYHSGNKAVNVRYRRKVLATWDQLRRRHERQRIASGTSVLAPNDDQDEQVFPGPRSPKPAVALFAPRTDRRPWTLGKAEVAGTAPSWRDMLRAPKPENLRFKAHRPHAQVLVAIEPWEKAKSTPQRAVATAREGFVLLPRNVALATQAANQLGQ